MSNSEVDPDAMALLVEESKKTGKSILQILTERKGKVYREPKVTDKMAPEVAKTLAENAFVARPKKEEEE